MQWVKNLETGLVWEVEDDHARRLIGQRTGDGETEYAKVPAPKPPKADGQSGDETPPK